MLTRPNMVSSPPQPSGQDSSRSDWNPLLVLVVPFICTIILLISYRSLFKRICCWLHGVAFNRTQGERWTLDEANPEDPSHSHALEPSIIHSLPITRFRLNNKGELASRNTDCAICLGEFEEGELQRHLPNCTHAFHIYCIDTWFQTHSNCPVCRSQVCNLAIDSENPVSENSPMETLRREDYLQERAANYQL